jgi:hypothetical protein
VALPPAPVARRLRPPSWRDRRLLAGVVLVLASVACGVAVVGQADTTEPMYAASHALVPGQQLTSADVHAVRVRLGRQAGRYLPAGRSIAAGSVVIRGVQDGELVPVSAVGGQQAVTSRPVAVVVPAVSADGLRTGSLVDVWVAAKGTAAQSAQTYDEPKIVVSSAEVVSVSSGGGVLSSSTETSVRLLLTNDLVPQLLSAVDNGARIDLVPVPGSVPRGGS